MIFLCVSCDVSVKIIVCSSYKNIAWGIKKKKKKDKPSQWFYIHVFMGKSLCSKHKAKNCLTESELDQQLLWLSKECPTVSEFHAVEKEMFGRQLLNSFHVIFFPGTLKEISEKIFCVFNFL